MELQTKILIPKNTTVIDTFKSDLPNFKHDCQVTISDNTRLLTIRISIIYRMFSRMKTKKKPSQNRWVDLIILKVNQDKNVSYFTVQIYNEKGLEYCKEDWVQFLSNN